MNDQRLRHRRAATFVKAEMSMEARRMYKLGGLPFVQNKTDPRGIVLAFANDAVERQMRPNGVTQ